MPFEFMIQLHRRIDNGGEQLATEGAGVSASPSRPRGIEMFLAEPRIDFGGIMQVWLLCIESRSLRAIPSFPHLL